ncbi:hypothetical protein BH09PSE6_BH09PSE6_29020 [soil metagenome]
MAIDHRNASRTTRPVLSTHFVWDDGSGQTSCSALYFETRNFQRVAVGRAVEARINGDDSLAASYDLKAHQLARELTSLREARHVGRSELRNKSSFSETFAKISSASLSLT